MFHKVHTVPGAAGAILAVLRWLDRLTPTAVPGRLEFTKLKAEGQMVKGTNVATRLTLGFGLMTVLILLLAFVGGTRMGLLNAQAEQLAGKRLQRVAKVAQWELSVLHTARHVRNVLIFSADQVKAEFAAIRQDRKERDQLLAYFNQSFNLAADRAELKPVTDASAEYLRWEDEYLKMAEGNDLGKAATLDFEHFGPAQTKFVDALDKLRELEVRDGEQQAREAADVYDRGLLTLAAVSLAAAIVSLITGFWITRSITRPLGGEPEYAAAIATSIAAGDLAVNVKVAQGDESSLLYAMNRMVATLRGTVGAIKAAADLVGSASSEISQGNQDLSSRTEEQASALEETAASMEEMTVTVSRW
jgi:methyl-accepting chemotaxis protein